MCSFKVTSLFALVCLVGSMTCDVFDAEIKEACAKEFSASDVNIDHKAADDLPENVQCYMKCLVVKTAAKDGAGSDLAVAAKLIKEPEEREQFEKCTTMMKDDSCKSYANFLVCLKDAMKM